MPSLSLRRGGFAFLAILVLIGVATASSLLGAPAPATALQHRASVVLVDRFDAWLPPQVVALRANAPAPRVIIIRRPAGTVMLVTRETQPEDLATAASQLIGSLRSVPVANKEMRAYIVPATTSIGRDRARAAKDLQRLAKAREYQIAGIGRHKAITVRLNVKPAKPATTSSVAPPQGRR